MISTLRGTNKHSLAPFPPFLISSLMYADRFNNDSGACGSYLSSRRSSPPAKTSQLDLQSDQQL